MGTSRRCSGAHLDAGSRPSPVSRFRAAWSAVSSSCAETGDRAKNSSSSSNSKAGRRKRSWKNESSCFRSHCEEDGGSVMDMLLTLAMICVLATVFFEGARHWLLESDETATTTSSSSSSLEYEVDALRHEAKANKTGRRIPTATTTTAAQSKRVCTAKSSSESRPGESLEQGRRIMTRKMRKKARRRRFVRERDWDDNNVDDGVFEEVVWTESVLKCWEECQRRTYCVNFVVRLSIGGVKVEPNGQAQFWCSLVNHERWPVEETTVGGDDDDAHQQQQQSIVYVDYDDDDDQHHHHRDDGDNYRPVEQRTNYWVQRQMPSCGCS